MRMYTNIFLIELPGKNWNNNYQTSVTASNNGLQQITGNKYSSR